jgi:hypothetical protein
VACGLKLGMKALVGCGVWSLSNKKRKMKLMVARDLRDSRVSKIPLFSHWSLPTQSPLKIKWFQDFYLLIRRVSENRYFLILNIEVSGEN